MEESYFQDDPQLKVMMSAINMTVILWRRHRNTTEGFESGSDTEINIIKCIDLIFNQILLAHLKSQKKLIRCIDILSSQVQSSFNVRTRIVKKNKRNSNTEICRESSTLAVPVCMQKAEDRHWNQAQCVRQNSPSGAGETLHLQKRGSWGGEEPRFVIPPASHSRKIHDVRLHTC